MKKDVAPPGKPSWDDAPDGFMGLGVATWDCEYKGEWCWVDGTGGENFAFFEKRPRKHRKARKEGENNANK